VFGQACGPRGSSGRAGSSNTVSLEDVRRELAAKRARR
jgi:hypothetical protein